MTWRCSSSHTAVLQPGWPQRGSSSSQCFCRGPRLVLKSVHWALSRAVGITFFALRAQTCHIRSSNPMSQVTFGAVLPLSSLVVIQLPQVRTQTGTDIRQDAEPKWQQKTQENIHNWSHSWRSTSLTKKICLINRGHISSSIAFPHNCLRMNPPGAGPLGNVFVLGSGDVCHPTPGLSKLSTFPPVLWDALMIYQLCSVAQAWKPCWHVSRTLGIFSLGVTRQRSKVGKKKKLVLLTDYQITSGLWDVSLP